MNKKNLRNLIKGWFPQEPKVPGKYAGERSEKKQGLLDKPLSQLSPDTVLRVVFGFLLVLIGVLGFIFINQAVATVEGILVLAPVAGLVGYFFVFWGAVVAVVVIAVLVATHAISGKSIEQNFTKRRLLPYIVAAVLIYSAYLVSNSGIQFSYAIPIAFVVSGLLVFKGLKRFAVTGPAFAVLLVSMLVFGCAAAGPTFVTYSYVSRTITTAEEPNLVALNITARSVEGDIRLYFTDNSSQVCTVQYVEQYGVVRTGLSTSYLGPGSYADEPAPVFYYYVNNSEAYVIADSFSTLMNITVNENLIGNFSLYTYYGDVTVNVPPNVNTVQCLNLTTILGTANLKVSNTSDLRYASAKGSTVDANVASNGQTQNSTVQLYGENINLNLQASNIRSQISASATGPYGGAIKTSVHGFNVLTKTGTQFNAQTPNYETSFLHKLDVTAAANQQEGESFVTITANYEQK